jgi:DNA-directed RNA polymerase specialized sigma24 family protein
MTIEDEMSIHFQNVKYVTDENEALHSMIEESNRKLQEKDSQLQEKDSQLQETNQQLANSIKLLYSAGLSVDDIAAKLGIPVDKIQTILYVLIVLLSQI